MSGFLARSRRTFYKSLLQCIPGDLTFPALKFWLLIKFDFSSKKGVLVVKFAFAIAILKIETLRMRRRFARVFYLNNIVFLSRNYRLIVPPRKFDVPKTNMLILRTSNFQGATIRPTVRPTNTIVFIVHH